MKNKQNIEDIFRSEFEGFTQKPSDKVWNSINKKMVGPRFESLYHNAFKGFKIVPAEQTWRRIATALWFNRFIHFSPFHFNIYYLGLILTAVVGTVVTVNNNSNMDFIRFNDKFANAEKTKIQQIENESNKLDIWNLRNSKPNYFELSNENLDFEKLDKATNQTENIVEQDKTILYKTKEQEADNQDNRNLYQVKEQEVIEQNINDNTNPIGQTQKEIIANNIANINENQEEIVQNPPNITYFKLNKLIRNNIFTLTYAPTAFDIADKVIAGIPQLDVITYDTLGVDYKGNPIISEKSYFALDIFFNPFLQNYNNALLNTELQANLDIYNKNITPHLSFSAGIGVAYSYNKFRLETGLAYQQLHESFSANINSYETSTHNYYNYFNDEVWESYTILILDIDEFIQGNIVYIEYNDSILAIVPDSTLVSYTDSILVNKDLNINDTYHFIDVPLVGGYEFDLGKFSVTPKAGLITSILVAKGGQYYDISQNDVAEISNCPDTKFMFDYYGAINLQYKIGKHFAIYIEPHLRGDLNSKYQKSYVISQKSIKYGLKTGVYIKF
ncbi:MAG: hypothetical protein PHP52_01080 [Bacteroidales bacterium]|nr:hypothetical protein [Bacteroidales bacterium]MDD4216135.1 hypothetical protein [Bacteroidales bacterium]